MHGTKSFPVFVNHILRFILLYPNSSFSRYSRQAEFQVGRQEENPKVIGRTFLKHSAKTKQLHRRGVARWQLDSNIASDLVGYLST